MVLVRHLTAATAAITLALLLVEMLCYVLRRLHSSCVLSTKIGQHRGELLFQDHKATNVFKTKIVGAG